VFVRHTYTNSPLSLGGLWHKSLCSQGCRIPVCLSFLFGRYHSAYTKWELVTDNGWKCVCIHIGFLLFSYISVLISFLSTCCICVVVIIKLLLLAQHIARCAYAISMTFKRWKILIKLCNKKWKWARKRIGRCHGYLHAKHTHTHCHFTVLCPDYPEWAGTRRDWCQESLFWILRGVRKIIEANDNPAGCHSIGTIEAPISVIPQFYAGCPSCRSPPNLSWLGTGTKYAGLNAKAT